MSYLHFWVLEYQNGNFGVLVDIFGVLVGIFWGWNSRAKFVGMVSQVAPVAQSVSARYL